MVQRLLSPLSASTSCLLLSAVLLAGRGTCQAQLAQGAHIPQLHGTTLSGQTVDLPAALQGRAGVLIVGFSRDSRDQATAWGKRLATDFGSSNTVSYFEMPALDGVPRMLRGVVLRSIAKDVSPRGQAHFLPILSDGERWRALARLTDPKNAAILLVNGAGEVRWQTEGELTEPHYEALQKALRSVLPGA